MAEVQKNRASTICQLEIRIRRRTKFEISTVYSERTHLIHHVHVYRVYINPIHVKYVPLCASLWAVFLYWFWPPPRTFAPYFAVAAPGVVITVSVNYDICHSSYINYWEDKYYSSTDQESPTLPSADDPLAFRSCWFFRILIKFKSKYNRLFSYDSKWAKIRWIK